MDNFDLNLLRIFDVLWRLGHLGRAAEELELSQPALSHALKRLREQLGDVLFIKTHSGMLPSSRAIELAPTVQSILATVRENLLTASTFDSKLAKRNFTIALSDVGEMAFLPRLLAHVAEEAPNINIATISLAPHLLSEGLQRGQIDLAVGYFPDLQGTDIYQQRLFRHGFVCLVRSSHPAATNGLTREFFMELSHVVVQSEGRSQEIVEQYLKENNIERRKMLHSSHFLSVPMIIAATDLIVTVPEPVGDIFAKIADLKVLRPPFPFPEFDLKQSWHRCQHADSANQWLRRTLQMLFSTQDGNR